MLALQASDVAFGNDAYCVSDATPDGVVGKRHLAYLSVKDITPSPRIFF